MLNRFGGPSWGPSSFPFPSPFPINRRRGTWLVREVVAPSWQVLTDFIGQRQEVQGHLVDIETLVIKRQCYRIPPENGNGTGNVYE